MPPKPRYRLRSHKVVPVTGALDQLPSHEECVHGPDGFGEYEPKQLNHLPIEMLINILSNIDLQELIHLRGVNSIWNEAIGAIGHRVRALVLRYTGDKPSRINRWLGPKKFSHVRMKLIIRTIIDLKQDLFDLLLELFPLIETLVIDFGIYIRNHTDDSRLICNYLNSLTNLKQLQLGRTYGIKVDTVDQLAPTLGRLERFFVSTTFQPEAGRALTSYLGPCCTHLTMNHHVVTAKILAQLTHLCVRDLNFFWNGPSDWNTLKTLQLISEKAIALKELTVDLCYPQNMLTIEIFALFARLPHLTKLYLKNAQIDMDVLAHDHYQHIVQLSNVIGLGFSNCYCFVSDFDHFNTGDTFARIFSSLFPNLEELYLDWMYRIIRGSAFRADKLEPDLSKFTKLRKYRIDDDETVNEFDDFYATVTYDLK